MSLAAAITLSTLSTLSPGRLLFLSMSRNGVIYVLSTICLIITGHYLAKYLSSDKHTAWIWVALFYGSWMLTTILVTFKRSEFWSLFKKAAFHFSLIIPLAFAAIALVGIFIPNLHLLKLDQLLFFNVIICLFNPFLEETYWRALPSKMLNNKFAQYSIASLGFAMSHPLILGVNSPGAAGWPTLVGAFILGSCWWIYYNKRQSLRWPVFTHFLIDVFGMAAYLLADKTPLLI